MTERIKIAYIGAGSFRFSTGFFNDMIVMSDSNSMPIEVALCDIDEESLKLMQSYFQKIIETNTKYKGDIKISTSTNRRDALENADFVYKSLSVGKQESEWFDIYLPRKFGIPQNTGDTVGPGGVFRGLRVIPAVVGIAKDMKELCPKAPLLNYTNPQSTLVMAAKTVAPDVQFIGLCHELFGGMSLLVEYAKDYLNIKIQHWQEFDIKYAGLNHFAWLTEFKKDGMDLYENLRQDAHKLVLKSYWYSGFKFYLLEKFGYLPYPGDRHLAEFLPDYFNNFNHKIQSPYWKFPSTRNVSRIDNNRRSTYQRIRKVVNSHENYEVKGSSDEKAMDMMLDFLNNNNAQHVANMPNHFNGKKIVSQLPKDCVIEIPAYFHNKILTPTEGITLPANIADIMIPHCEQQRLTVDAAMGNDINLVYKAMLHDPMCRWVEDDEMIKHLTNIMLYYEQQWLPNEWSGWIPKLDEVKQSKWWISKAELSLENEIFLEKRFGPKQELKSKSFFWEE